MKKTLTSHWFWLILIFILILIELIIQVDVYYEITLYNYEAFWSAIASIATLLGVFVAVITYMHSEKVRKRQATYDAYNQFKNNVFELENEILSYNIDDILEKKKQRDSRNTDVIQCVRWDKIKNYLAQIERIATSVNAGVFDLETIYNMGGPFMINMYKKLENIIKYKRQTEQRDTVYEEFETLVNALLKIHFARAN